MKNRQSAAVDAHWGATTPLYYYKDVHGRTGVDNKGSQVQSRVHTSEGFDNAYCERRDATRRGARLAAWFVGGQRGRAVERCGCVWCSNGVHVF